MSKQPSMNYQQAIKRSRLKRADWQRKQQQRQNERNKKIIFFVLIISITTMIISLMIYNHKQKEQNYNYETTTIHYVSKGETIWTIANQYSDNRHDTRRVVFEIEKLNETNTLIFPGQEIIVPIYIVMDEPIDE